MQVQRQSWGWKGSTGPIPVVLTVPHQHRGVFSCQRGAPHHPVLLVHVGAQLVVAGVGCPGQGATAAAREGEVHPAIQQVLCGRGHTVRNVAVDKAAAPVSMERKQEASWCPPCLGCIPGSATLEGGSGTLHLEQATTPNKRRRNKDVNKDFSLHPEPDTLMVPKVTPDLGLAGALPCGSCHTLSHLPLDARTGL